SSHPCPRRHTLPQHPCRPSQPRTSRSRPTRSSTASPRSRRLLDRHRRSPGNHPPSRLPTLRTRLTSSPFCSPSDKSLAFVRQECGNPSVLLRQYLLLGARLEDLPKDLYPSRLPLPDVPIHGYPGATMYRLLSILHALFVQRRLRLQRHLQ